MIPKADKKETLAARAQKECDEWMAKYEKREKFLLNFVVPPLSILALPLVLPLGLVLLILLAPLLIYSNLPKVQKRTREFKAEYIKQLKEEQERLKEEEIKQRNWDYGD